MHMPKFPFLLRWTKEKPTVDGLYLLRTSRGKGHAPLLAWYNSVTGEFTRPGTVHFVVVLDTTEFAALALEDTDEEGS